MELFEHFKNNKNRETYKKIKGASSSTQTFSYFDGGAEVDLEDDFARFIEQLGQVVNKIEVEVYL